MDAKEIRKGNFIYNDFDLVCEVYSIESSAIYGELFIRFEKNYHVPVSVDDCKSIPLTGEWLIKLGLLKTNGLSFLMGSFEIIRNKENTCWLVMLKGGIIARLEFVHQLQNFRFALDGEELTIKPN